MKYSYLIFILALAVACGTADKQKELDQLRSDKSEIENKIAALEEEMAKSDTLNIKTTDVRVMRLEPRTFKTYIEVQGRIDAEENVSLSTEIPGTITRIHVNAGDKVVKGQVLAETDTRPLQQQIAAMQASFALVNQVFEKQKNLWDQKIGTEMQFLQARTAKEGLESGLAGMQEQVRMSKIISPIEGTVDNVNIKIGQSVAPGMPAITVINFKNLTVKADVAESYTARIKTGNEALVVFPDMKDSLFSKVHYASRAINPLTRTFNVEIKLDNKKEYHPNMVAKLKINDYLSEQPVLVMPVKYIQKGTRESYVMVAEDGVAVKKVIRAGREYAGMTEISEGLSAGDMIITEGYDLVNEGDRVLISE